MAFQIPMQTTVHKPEDKPIRSCETETQAHTIPESFSRKDKREQRYEREKGLEGLWLSRFVPQ